MPEWPDRQFPGQQGAARDLDPAADGVADPLCGGADLVGLRPHPGHLEIQSFKICKETCLERAAKA